MNAPAHPIPDDTIQATARTLHKETSAYGFRQIDYLRLVTQLLDLSMHEGSPSAVEEPVVSYNTAVAVDLPAKSEGICIRAFDGLQDMDRLRQWINDPVGRYFLLSRISARRMDLEALTNDPNNILGVVLSPDGTAIGMMAFLDYDRVQRKAELRKLIGDSRYRGKGLAKKATALWIRYGLTTLGIRKIYVNTLDSNLRNIRLNEELGFTIEGILRDECYFDGGYHDIVRMAMLH